jgi:hypothetical protein
MGPVLLQGRVVPGQEHVGQLPVEAALAAGEHRQPHAQRHQLVGRQLQAHLLARLAGTVDRPLAREEVTGDGEVEQTREGAHLPAPPLQQHHVTGRPLGEDQAVEHPVPVALPVHDRSRQRAGGTAVIVVHVEKFLGDVVSTHGCHPCRTGHGNIYGERP